MASRTSDRPMKMAYADPPFPGMAAMYKHHPDFAGEVDHVELVARLLRDYPDGWALSTGSVNLRMVLSICPADVHVMAWCKSWCKWYPGRRIVFAWEPVIIYGGRPGSRDDQSTQRDWFVASVERRTSFKGAKPLPVMTWIFACLGLRPGDTLDDLFPGTGAVTRAWSTYQAQRPLPLTGAVERQHRLGASDGS